MKEIRVSIENERGQSEANERKVILIVSTGMYPNNLTLLAIIDNASWGICIVI